MKKDVPDYFLQEMSKYKNAHYCDGIKFFIGPLLGLISGLEKAKELGLDVVVYRNGDDWLFNHNFVIDNLKRMKNNDVGCYNWFTYNSNQEFALNELYLKVDPFCEKIQEMKKYVINSNDKLLCEFKMAKWISRTTKKIYRLPNREEKSGIGIHDELFEDNMKNLNYKITPEMTERLKVNNRYFNEKWQLVGCHDNAKRHEYYMYLRNKIPYHMKLEQEFNFRRWLNKSNPWNLESEIKKTKDVKDIKKTPRRIISCFS